MASLSPLATPSASPSRAFLECHLGATIAPFPDEVREALYTKFCEFYASPCTCDLEFVLQKRLTDDEVRHLVFAPTPTQYRHYATLLGMTSKMLLHLKKRFLTLFYLHHAAHNWPLVVEFMLHDGLQVLVGLFSDSDLQTRGQAIDSFVQITSHHAGFDWFDKPVGYEAKLLHAKMVALSAASSSSTSPGLLSQIVANIQDYAEPEQDVDSQQKQRQKLPGGSFVLLQVLAFYLSWVRKMYTQNELRLSTQLLSLLRDWPTNTQTDNQEEIHLAKQVYEDFSRWPVIDEAPQQQEQDHIKVSAAQKNELFFSAALVDQLLADSDDGEALDKAIALCTRAIDANVNQIEALTKRAQAYKRRRLVATQKLEADDFLALCLSDCSRILEMEPHNMDARRCQLDVLDDARPSSRSCWIKGLAILETLLDDSTAANNKEKFLAADLSYLADKKQTFQSKLNELMVPTLCVVKETKQNEIYQLVRQRHKLTAGGSPPPADQEPQTHHRTKALSAEAARLAETTPSPPPVEAEAAAPPDLLARFFSSSCGSAEKAKTKTKTKKKKKKKEEPLTATSKKQQQPSLLGQLTRCKRDLPAIQQLLTRATVDDVAKTVQSPALPDPLFVLIVQAVVASCTLEQEETTSHRRPPTTHAVRLLQVVLGRMPRLDLLCELASSSADQQKIAKLIQQAHAALACAGIESGDGYGIDATAA